MATANEELYDALVRHQINLQRLSGGTRRRLVELLNLTERQLRMEIIDGLAGIDPMSRRGQRRINNIIETIRNLRAGAFQELTDEFIADMNELAEAEQEFTENAILAVSPVRLDLTQASVAGLVSSRLMEGRTVRQWANSLRNLDTQRIADH